MVFPFIDKKRSIKSFYLGLLLKEKEGIAMVLKLDGEKEEILEKEKFSYSNGWENLTEDIDEVLFQMEKKLNIELKETILFVYSHLINEKGTEIKKPYLNKIKELVRNLEISPLGYIESYEGVSLYLTEKEEVPLTGILVEIDNTQISIFIYKGGKVSYRRTLPKTDNIIEDLLTGFSQLKGSYLLPTRIILYNSRDLGDESAKILSYHWSEEYFVQLPKVEILKEEEVIKGLVRVFKEQEKKMTKSRSSFEQTEEATERLGFVIGGDVVGKKQEKPTFNGIIYSISKIKEILKKINFPIISWRSQRLLAIIGSLFIILGLFINELFFHKATLTVFLPFMTLKRSTTVEIPYKIATVSAEFSDSKKTSGKREIGQKAKGEVVVYNTNLNKEKLFKKGTEIEFEGLKFVFDEDVNVASASSATNPGTKKVKVTAAAIGSEYNLSKGKRFNIDETSYAQNIVDFTGGSRKEIETISQKDKEDLKTAIIEKAKKSNKIPIKDFANQIVIPQFSTFELKKAEFSGEVGEEAVSLTIKGKVDSVYYYYQKNELLKALYRVIKSYIPPGFVLRDDSINYTVDSVSKKDSIISLNLTVKAKAIKKITSLSLLKKVTGKHKNNLDKFLQDEFQAQGYNIKIKNSLPILKDFLPFFEKNITLIISSF